MTSFRCLLLLQILLVTGCAAKTEVIPTAPVKGVVTLDGKPLEDGTITFYPDVDASGSPLKGQMAQGRISQGTYEIPNPPGVTVGKNRIAISATKVTGKETLDGVEIEKREQYLPAKFNSDTTLACDVQAGPNSHDFQITSK